MTRSKLAMHIGKGVVEEVCESPSAARSFRSYVYLYARRHNLFKQAYIKNETIVVFVLSREEIDPLEGAPSRGFSKK